MEPGERTGVVCPPFRFPGTLTWRGRPSWQGQAQPAASGRHSFICQATLPEELPGGHSNGDSDRKLVAVSRAPALGLSRAGGKTPQPVVAPPPCRFAHRRRRLTVRQCDIGSAPPGSSFGTMPSCSSVTFNPASMTSTFPRAAGLKVRKAS
ncbi:hypothetical protein DAERI_070147 [Deinococcus aerius]|uniref:Uncharacterized protein n=1 Tax=Deinococcus aerius TaxID=200253 RepID=A0A2I9CVZ6_9DEIO|nr:hypothetical protein DAERI_070147 [Deinococcus aerius]